MYSYIHIISVVWIRAFTISHVTTGTALTGNLACNQQLRCIVLHILIVCGVQKGFSVYIQKATWHRDMGIQKEVMELKVKCSNAVHGCKWQDRMRNLEVSVCPQMYYTVHTRMKYIYSESYCGCYSHCSMTKRAQYKLDALRKPKHFSKQTLWVWASTEVRNWATLFAIEGAFVMLVVKCHKSYIWIDENVTHLKNVVANAKLMKSTKV